MSEHASDYQLDALRIGPGDPEVLRHVEACAVCRARRDALTEDAAAFHRRFQLPGLAADALARAERAPRWRGWLAGLAIAAGAAVVLLVAVNDGVRTKGAPTRLELFLRTEGGPSVITGPVPADGRLAVRVTAPEPRFVRLLWESAPDAWGALYPAEDDAAWAVEGSVWLEREIVLDGAPEPERLGAVFCEAPVDHARAVALLDGAEGCAVETIQVLKR